MPKAKPSRLATVEGILVYLIEAYQLTKEPVEGIPVIPGQGQR
jgi:hypothetical protein